MREDPLINLVLYHALLVAVLGSVLGGRKWVLYAMALLLPLIQTLPSPYGFVASPPNALLLGLLALRLRLDPKDLGPPPPLRASISVWLLMLVLGAIRVLSFPEPDATVPPMEVVLKVWYWSTPFLVFFLVYRLASDRLTAMRIVQLCMLSAGGEALLAVHERLMGVGRATAHLDEPNRAGAYFAGVVVLFFAFVLLERRRVRWLFIGAWMLGVAALFATLSRGGMLSATLGSTLVFTGFLLQSRAEGAANKTFSVILVVLIAINGSLLLPERVTNRLLHTVGGDPSHLETPGQLEKQDLDSSAAKRLTLWTWGLGLFEERPFGHGAFTAQMLMGSRMGLFSAMHNIYLQILVELGFQGLLALLLLILSVMVALARSYRLATVPADMALSLGLMGYWLALCVAHFFVNPFFMLHMNGQFWVMAACATRLVRLPERAEPAPSRPKRFERSARQRPAAVTSP